LRAKTSHLAHHPPASSAASEFKSHHVAIAAGFLILVLSCVTLWLRKRSQRHANLHPDSTPAPIPPNSRIGDVEILSVLADGGTATIYRGEDADCNMVAIKIPHRQLVRDSKFVATFQKEAKVGVELRHPSIVRVYHAGNYRAGGFSKIPFFVMEFLEGQELESWLKEHGPMEARSAAKLARGVADALQWAHQRGVVHRDISPRNIFLTSKRTVKVMDFGISSTSKIGGRREKGLTYGTPEYLAPERIQKPNSSDPRSDLYALGCVFYEMVAGKPPFLGNSPEQTVIMHLRAPVPPIGDGIRIPAEIDAIIQRLLAKDPAERFQSAAEVISALAEATPDSYESGKVSFL
jgi:serine/threonine protein kinase